MPPELPVSDTTIWSITIEASITILRHHLHSFMMSIVQASLNCQIAQGTDENIKGFFQGAG